MIGSCKFLCIGSFEVKSFNPNEIFEGKNDAVLNCVVFIGSPLMFSQRLLDAFKSAFRWLDFKLISEVGQLKSISESGEHIVMVVVGEDNFEALTDNPRNFAQAVDGAKIIAAYHHPRKAAKLLQAKRFSDDCGSIGFLPLNVQVDVWVSVMNLLLCGEIFYPSELFDGVPHAPAPGNSETDDDINLTPREWEVLSLVAVGMQNKNIASDLSLSQHTVKLHIHNVLKKIGVSNRTCAASWYNSSRGRTQGAQEMTGQNFNMAP